MSPAPSEGYTEYSANAQTIIVDYREQQKLNPFVVMFAGGLAGMCNWASAIAPDTIKSRFQTGIIISNSHTLLLLHIYSTRGKV